ncbi:MAG: nitrophenyl compound nitroreductase subunit ArsF family protein [Flavobacterium sp.]
MTKKISLLTFVFLTMLFAACKQEPKENAENVETTSVLQSDATVQLIQFHSEHRCMTCSKIESLAIESLTSVEGVPFQLINVDDKTNATIAEEFEATGTALYLYNTQTGAKKDLTEFAFMKAGDQEAFKTELTKEILTFKEL